MAGYPRAVCRNGHRREGDNLDKDGRCRACARNTRARAAARRRAVREAAQAAQPPPVRLCRKGHELTPENRLASRRCRICAAASRRVRRAIARGDPNPQAAAIPLDQRSGPTRCRRGHLRTPGNVDKRGRCIICQRNRIRQRREQVVRVKMYRDVLRDYLQGRLAIPDSVSSDVYLVALADVRSIYDPCHPSHRRDAA